MLLTSILVFSQDVYKTYTMESLSAKKPEYNVKISEKNGEIIFWIETFGLDNIYDVVFLKIKENEVNNFVKFLKTSEQKFISWKNIAVKNNVKKVTKEIKLKYTVRRVRFKTSVSDWYTSTRTRLKSIFYDLTLVIKNNYKLISMSNEFIKSDGFVLVFKNKKEIDNLISILNISKAKEFISNKKKKENLFH